MVGVEGVLVRTHDPTKTERAIHHSVYLAPLRSFRELKPKVGQSTLLLHFGPFRALLKVLPVSELYFRVTDLDLVHPVFLLKAFQAIHVRYGDNAGHNKAKMSLPGALEAKPEVEIWRRPNFLTRRPRLSS